MTQACILSGHSQLQPSEYPPLFSSFRDGQLLTLYHSTGHRAPGPLLKFAFTAPTSLDKTEISIAQCGVVSGTKERFVATRRSDSLLIDELPVAPA